MRHMWVWATAVVIVGVAVVFALMKTPPPKQNSSPFRDPIPETEVVLTNIVPKNAPVVTGFVGDLLNKGNLDDDSKELQPFVVGEVLKLEVTAHNAVEYCWKLNGKVLKEKDQEWSSLPERFYDVTEPGKHTFSVQVRGADKSLVSIEKQVTLDILPLKIVRVEKNIIHDDDQRFVTGDEITIEVTMASAMNADPEFYQFRYFVNDEPIKHPDEDPDDDGDWTHNSALTYEFAAPGSYTFKVEARRSTKKEAEGQMELPETVIAADAVLLSLDSFPDNEKPLGLGHEINLNSFPVSRYGKSECRFGVKKINAADYRWLAEDSGEIWGESSRNWVPTEPGTYLIRCEVREIGKEKADDFREMYFTITDGNF